MTIVEKAVQWAIKIANDNSHGYSQVDRWGPDYDCSSFVIQAYEQAGVKVKEAGASYTGNMKSAFISCGFIDVTSQCGLTSGYGIKAGDVLLNYSAHTCIAIGNGKVANCRTDEGHPQAGDQSGNEIRIQSYWNYPWNCVLRLREDKPINNSNTTNTTKDHDLKLEMVSYNNKFSYTVVLLQLLLTKRDFPCGEIDGYFGKMTKSAVLEAQSFFKITKDGIVGNETWGKLLEYKK